RGSRGFRFRKSVCRGRRGSRCAISAGRKRIFLSWRHVFRKSRNRSMIAPMPATNNLRFLVTIALFAALALFAWKSGRRVYEEAPDLDIREEGGAVILRWAHAVEAPMAERFEKAFARWKGKTERFVIELDSPGGAIVEGRLVIDEIEK